LPPIGFPAVDRWQNTTVKTKIDPFDQPAHTGMTQEKTRAMRAFLAMMLCGFSGVTAVAAAPLTTTEYLEVDGHRLAIPLEIYLEPAGTSRINVKVAGNLRSLQANISGLMSDVVVDKCKIRIALQIDKATAEDDDIRLAGRTQVTLYSCNAEEDLQSRTRTISNIVGINALVHGRIANNCLQAKLESLELDPSGLVGAALNLIGLTESIAQLIRDDLNATLSDEDLCFDLPEVLQVLNTHVSSGGFRDFGNGELGFVVKGRLDVTAQGALDLIGMLPDLNGGCEC
jgi:hypothetical protein